MTEKLIYSTKDEPDSGEWVKIVDRLPYHMQNVRVCIHNAFFGEQERIEDAIFLAFDNNFYDTEEQILLHPVTKWRPLHEQIKDHVIMKGKRNK